MTYYTPGCMGKYNFDNIALYARKRFVEGYNTIDLLQQATSPREKEEISLVAMLDLDEKTVKNMNLYCKHADKCQITSCQEVIKNLLEAQLVT